MRALSELLTLLKLNLLTILCSIPVVTAGAAVTSMHYCVMKMIDAEDSHVVSMFFRQFKANLKGMIPPWLIILVLYIFLFLDLKIFPAQGNGGLRPMVVLVYLALIVLHGICQWIFPLGARFENSMGAKFRNAFRMMVTRLPRTLAMMGISAVIPLLLILNLRLLPLLFLFGLSLPAYLCAMLYLPVIKEQIRLMTGEAEEDEEVL